MTAETRLFQLSDVEDLQYVEAVVKLHSKGIVSISNICKSLLDAQVDQTTDKCSNYKQIRVHIKHASQCLEKSALLTEEKLGDMDKCMVRFIKDQKDVEQQKKEKCMTKDKLHTEKNSAEELLKNSKAAFEQAEKNVELAKHALKKEKDMQVTGGWVTAAGIGLCMIPFAPCTIAGLTMLGKGSHLIGKTSKAIKDAEDELKENESQVNESSMKVSNYRSRISSIQNEIQEMDKELNEIQRKIEEVKQQLTITADIQQMVRRAVNLLSVLRGRVTVLEKQTQCFILRQPVIKVMEDVVKAAENTAENQFLYSQGASGLINTLKETVEGLQALCDSYSNSEYDGYLN